MISGKICQRSARLTFDTLGANFTAALSAIIICFQNKENAISYKNSKENAKEQILNLGAFTGAKNDVFKDFQKSRCVGSKSTKQI